MEKQLLKYKELAPIEYLDGRYFNLVLRNIPGVVAEPLILRISKTGINIIGGVGFSKNVPVQYLRLIIEFVQEPEMNVQTSGVPASLSNHPNMQTIRLTPLTPPSPSPPSLPASGGQVSPRSGIKSQLEGRVLSRHSNLLIIDNNRKTISRFEPIIDNDLDSIINQKLMEVLNPSFASYTYKELDVHPQHRDRNIGLCVAYVIKFVLFHSAEGTVSFEGNYDIHLFADAVKRAHGVLPQGGADIEFGYYRGYGYGYPYGPSLGLGVGLTAGLLGAGLIGASLLPYY